MCTGVEGEFVLFLFIAGGEWNINSDGNFIDSGTFKIVGYILSYGRVGLICVCALFVDFQRVLFVSGMESFS